MIYTKTQLETNIKYFFGKPQESDDIFHHVPDVNPEHFM